MRFPPIFRGPALALFFIAAVAVAQCVVFARVVGLQREAAHILVMTGAERTRIQRIAFDVAMAHDGHPESAWRARVETMIGEIRADRGEIMRGGRYVLGPVGRDGLTDLARQVERYFAVARALERRPADDRAFAAMRVLRRALLDAFTRALEQRSAIIAWRDAFLTLELYAGLGFQLLAVGLVWWRLIGPLQRRVNRSLREISGQRTELLALFEQNPDAIAVYDREGFLAQANSARVELLRIPLERLRGRHFTSFLVPEERAAASAVFERALRGEHILGDTRMSTATGEAIDVAYRVSPSVIDGETRGVIIVSRDTSELHRSQALNETMSQRLAALYAIASARNSRWQQQVADALVLATEQLGLQCAMVAQTADGRTSIVSSVGDFAARNGIVHFPAEALGRLAAGSGDVIEIADASESAEAEPFQQAGWRNVIALSLRLEGTTLGLAGPNPRHGALRTADRDFLRIVAELLATIVGRGRQEERLDSLAFFDPLTGLPNRTQLTRKLDELIAAAESNDAQFALHFLDLDKFKAVNDACGHAMGDDVLRAVAGRFATCVRSTDMIARLGGDEFVILQMCGNGRQGARELAERISAAIAEPFRCDGQAHQLGCSIGISLFPDDGRDAQTLLRHADQAMYRAKQSHDRVAVFAA